MILYLRFPARRLGSRLQVIVENLFPFRMRQLADVDDCDVVSQEGMISGTNSRFGVIPDMCSRREYKVAAALASEQHTARR